MDNPQVTGFEMGWLVGAIDGEGCIGITRRNRKSRLGFTLKPHIQIANCDYSFIERCIDALGKLGVPYHVSHYKGKNRRRESWQITISGLKRVNTLLPLISHLLCDEKKEKAELVNEFIESRLNDWHAAPFTDRQLTIVEQVSDLNVKGRKPLNLRDYTRGSRSSKYPKWDEDIVQTTT